MATESYVQPPPNNVSGPKLATVAKTVGGIQEHHYAVVSGKLTKIVTGSLLRSGVGVGGISGYSIVNGTSAVMDFSSVLRLAGETGAIVSARCSLDNNSTNVPAKPALELFLISSTTEPAHAVDLAQFTLADADIPNLVGIVTFGTSSWYSGTTGSTGSSVGIGT